MNLTLKNNLLVLILIMLLTGCASNQMYRTDYKVCDYQSTGQCASHALQRHAPDNEGNYHLGFVEYDDQGQLRDRAQMNAVLDEYYDIAAKNEVLLITFIHGWQHNASPEDSNIQSFRDLLTRASRYESRGSLQQGRVKRKVLGLYIGWRGESIDVTYLNNISFWDRKNTAHDVGMQGVTEVLLKLEEIVNVKIGTEDDQPPSEQSRLVVIGHSFGGAVLYTALQKVLTDRYINSRRGKTYSGNVEGFGDLVVLMNPAFEAIRFAGLYDLSQQHCRAYFPDQLPRLAILTSEADYATRYAFPAGRFFSTIFESHITLNRHYCSAAGRAGIKPLAIDEGKADRNTVGHFKPYITHNLNPSDTASTRTERFKIQDLQTAWANQKHGNTIAFEGSELQSRGRTTALNPYLNIRVDEALIGDHNDIWGDRVVAFLRDLIAISTTPR